MDRKALQTYLDNGKIAGVGLDVAVHEGDFIRKDLSGQTLRDKVFWDLIQRPNVLYMPHIAFLTDNAVSTIIGVTFQNLYLFQARGHGEHDLW